MLNEWPAPGTNDEMNRANLLRGFIVWAFTNILYATIVFFILDLLNSKDLINTSFTWIEICRLITALQVFRFWDRNIIRG